MTQGPPLPLIAGGGQRTVEFESAGTSPAADAPVVRRTHRETKRGSLLSNEPLSPGPMHRASDGSLRRPALTDPAPGTTRGLSIRHRGAHPAAPRLPERPRLKPIKRAGGDATDPRRQTGQRRKRSTGTRPRALPASGGRPNEAASGARATARDLGLRAWPWLRH
jgi:hypothetical protein